MIINKNFTETFIAQQNVVRLKPVQPDWWRHPWYYTTTYKQTIYNAMHTMHMYRNLGNFQG